MKYSPAIFAKAFLTALKETPKARHKELTENFIAVLKKYGTEKDTGKTVALLEKMAAREDGITRINIESARPLDKKALQNIKQLFKEKSIFTEEVDPELIAGVKLTIDDELIVDNSMHRKLKQLFV